MAGELGYAPATGQLVYSPATGQLAMNCEPSAPCECPSGLADCYRLVGYSDGDIQACPDCLDDTSSTIWDGTFTRSDFQCRWAPSSSPLRMDDKRLEFSYLVLNTDDDPDCYWELSIECEWGGISLTIWYGTKATGESPVGTYTRVSGCDTTSALEVEECP